MTFGWRRSAARGVPDDRRHPGAGRCSTAWRGALPSDVDALADLLVNISNFAAAHADDIETIDLNPVVALPRGEGAVALDALVVPRQDLR